jgi:hypothetical protein
MPVQLFRRIGVVVNVDDDAATFGQTQQRAGELAVIGLGRERDVRRQLDQPGTDAEDMVGRSRGRRRWRGTMVRSLGAHDGRQRRSQHRGTCQLQHPPTREPQSTAPRADDRLRHLISTSLVAVVGGGDANVRTAPERRCAACRAQATLL